MEPNFSELHVLIDLGLTPINARVYLALVKSGPLKTATLAEIANVARPDTYRTLAKLQKMGLVEKIVENPLRYRAIPMNEGLSLLLKTKTQDYKKVRAATQMLIDTAKKGKPNKEKLTENPQFVLIPEGRTFIERTKTAIENAQLSINLVVSWKRYSNGIINTFVESIENACTRNVKIRFIVEEPPENKISKNLIKLCRGKSCCQIRFIPNQPKAIFSIYDQNQILIPTISKMDLQSSPALWSNNDALISLALEHFEEIWRKAKKQID